MMTMNLSCSEKNFLQKFWESRVWPFGITWRHQSRDHRTRRGHFPIGGQWWPCIYLAWIRRYGAPKIMGSRPWPFGVTWRHRSRDHWTRHMWFPIGGPLEPCVYLAPLRRYWAPTIMMSRVWPFGVTLRHRSRDHWTRHMWFPIGGPLEPSVYLASLRRYWAPKIMGSRVWPFRVTWRHRSRDHWTQHMWFPIGGPLEPSVYLARRYKASNLHLPMLKAKSSLRMLRVTWLVGRGSKITTYLEFPRPHCLFTIQLLWGYNDENGKIRPRTDPKPLNRSTQNLKQVITSARQPPLQNFVQIRPLGASREMGEI